MRFLYAVLALCLLFVVRAAPVLVGNDVYLHAQPNAAFPRLAQVSGKSSASLDPHNIGLSTKPNTAEAHYATLNPDLTWAQANTYCSRFGYALCHFKDICTQGEGNEPIGADELPDKQVFVAIKGPSSNPSNVYLALTANAGDGVCTRKINPDFGTSTKPPSQEITKSLVACCTTKHLQSRGMKPGIVTTRLATDKMAQKYLGRFFARRRRIADEEERKRKEEQQRKEQAERERVERERLEKEKRERALKGKSCAEILKSMKAEGFEPKDGIYTLVQGSREVEVYCDQTTDGGGWTLVNYGFSQHANQHHQYYLPDSQRGNWDPKGRNGMASIDAQALLASSQHLILSVNEGGSAVNGNVKSYAEAYKWSNPGYQSFHLHMSTTSCAHVQVTEIKSGHSFGAYTFANRPQVSCSGHHAGTGAERQFIGFNSAACHGVCGSDPRNSMGMTVHRGDGYTPTTSGGRNNPMRHASFGLWLR